MLLKTCFATFGWGPKIFSAINSWSVSCSYILLGLWKWVLIYRCIQPVPKYSTIFIANLLKFWNNRDQTFFLYAWMWARSQEWLEHVNAQKTCLILTIYSTFSLSPALVVSGPTGPGQIQLLNIGKGPGLLEPVSVFFPNIWNSSMALCNCK